MLTDLLPDPFLWFSHHQWGTLLGGILGALLSALIAVWVLRRTLKTQNRQFRAQLIAQSDALHTQLRAQADALEKQLAAQADGIREQAEQQAAEASKERELAARAEIIVAVQELGNSTGDLKARLDTCTRISNGLEKWRFELQREDDRPLWQELDRWRSVLPLLVLHQWPGNHPMESIEGAELLLRGACGLLMNSLVEFRRNFDGTNWTAAEVARVLREFRENSLNAPGAQHANLE